MGNELSSWKIELEEKIKELGLKIQENDSTLLDLKLKKRILESVMFTNKHHDSFDENFFKKEFDYDSIVEELDELSNKIVGLNRDITAKISYYKAVLKEVEVVVAQFN